MSKKVIVIVMAAMISISLSGCGFSNTNNTTENTDTIVEDNSNLTGKWSRDFTLKDFTKTSDELISKIEKNTKEYGLEYTEEEVVRDNNEKTVNVENDKAEKNRLQSMYFSRILYGEDLASGQIKMKLLLNFDGKKAVDDKDFDLGSTSIAKYSEILTGVSNRDYSEINSKILDILNSSSGEGYFNNNIEGLTEEITVTNEYIVYSISTTKYDFTDVEQ